MLFGKEDDAAYVRACSSGDTGEELKLFQSTPKQYVFGLLITINNRAKKTLCCLKLKCDLNTFL